MENCICRWRKESFSFIDRSTYASMEVQFRLNTKSADLTLWSLDANCHFSNLLNLSWLPHWKRVYAFPQHSPRQWTFWRFLIGQVRHRRLLRVQATTLDRKTWSSLLINVEYIKCLLDDAEKHRHKWLWLNQIKINDSQFKHLILRKKNLNLENNKAFFLILNSYGRIIHVYCTKYSRSLKYINSTTT